MVEIKRTVTYDAFWYLITINILLKSFLNM